MGEVFITRKGGGGKAAAPTLAVTLVGGSFVQLDVTNNDQTNQATIFLLANYDTNSATDFDILAAQSGQVINVAAGTTVSTIVSGLDPDTSHTVSAQAAVIKKLSSNIITTDTINLSGTGIPAPTVGPITENTFTLTTFNVTNNDTVVSLIIKANITESTTVPSVYPFESSTLAPSTTGSITVSDLTSGTVYYIHARAFDGTVASSNVVFGPYTQEGPIVATGGTITNYSSGGVDYRAHTFTGNGTFSITNASVAPFNQLDYLIIAGGGSGGGRYYGGGGGAGGYRTTNGTSGRNSAARPKVTAVAQNYGITVGAGGSAVGASTQGNNGGTSSALGVSTTGGGGGGQSRTDGAGNNGGSGGGSNGGNITINVGTTDEGFAGGVSGDNPSSGGGGGGAGQVGQLGTRNNGNGAGGAGLANNLRTGSNETRAGGGGGAMNANNQYFIAPGGAGGGGNAAADYLGSAVQAQAGAVNTGSGGGAGCWNNTSNGAAGGSGIVVIRYVVGGL